MLRRRVYIRPGCEYVGPPKDYEDIAPDAIVSRYTDLVFPTPDLGVSDRDEVVNITPSESADRLIEKLLAEVKPADRVIEEPVFYFHYHVNNYLHFVRDNLPHLAGFLGLREKRPIKLLVFERGRIHPFYWEFLTALGIFSNEMIEVKKGETVRVNELYLFNLNQYNPKYEPFYSLHAPPVFSRVIKKLIYQFATSDRKDRKLYISRRPRETKGGIGQDNTINRKLMNEDVLVERLVKRGFEEVFLEDYTLPEKIKMMNEAEVMIQTQGAGVINHYLIENCRLIVFNSEFYHYDEKMKKSDEYNNTRTEVHNVYFRSGRPKRGNPNQPWMIDPAAAMKILDEAGL